MKTTIIVLILFSFAWHSQRTLADTALDRDAALGFSIQRPSNWIRQATPDYRIRIMLGFEGDGYVGNCNVNVLPLDHTKGQSQAQLDKSENHKPLSIAYYQMGLGSTIEDLHVLSVQHGKRGTKAGNIVDYTSSYFSPSVNTRIRMRSRLFSHAAPGKLYSLTCVTGSLTKEGAQNAFNQEIKNFEKFFSSLSIEDSM